MYAGQQDNSTISVPSRGIPSLTPFENWFNAGGTECSDIAVHPTRQAGAWQQAAGSLIFPLLLLGGLFFLFSRSQSGGGGGNPAMNFGKS